MLLEKKVNQFPVSPIFVYYILEIVKDWIQADFFINSFIGILLKTI